MSQPGNPLPHWWMEIRASGRASFGPQIVQEGYNDLTGQNFTLWQAAAFRLPVVQQEASGWWDALPTHHRLSPQDFLPPTTTSDFQINRQAKMLALAQALQACTEASGAETGILCEAARELQQCMAPLMTLRGDYIVEATLLRPTKEGLGPLPTLEEETALLSDEDEPAEEPTEWTTTPVTPASSCPASILHSCPSQKGEKLERIDVNPNNSSQWIQDHMKRDGRIPYWWEEFHPLDHSPDGHHDDAKVKTLAHLQAMAFCMPAAQKEVHVYWSTPPCLGVLGKREYLPSRDPRITWDYRRCRGRRHWHWLLCFRGAYPCWNLPKQILGSSAGAPQLPSLCGQGK